MSGYLEARDTRTCWAVTFKAMLVMAGIIGVAMLMESPKLVIDPILEIVPVEDAEPLTAE